MLFITEALFVYIYVFVTLSSGMGKLYNEIFYSIPLISQFHLHYIHNIQQTKLLKQCLSYDFGDILNRFKINLDACNNHNNATNNNNNINNKHNNISYRMSRFYTDYKYLYECAVNAKCETSNRFNTAECDFTPLMKLEKNNAIPTAFLNFFL